MPLLRFVLGGLYLFSAVAVVGLAAPLRRGLVPPNRWYGVRTRRALSSEPHWYVLNRVGARQLDWYALALAITGIAALFLRRPDGLGFWALLAAPVVLLVPPLWAIRRCSRALPEDPVDLARLLPGWTVPGSAGRR